MVRAVPEWRACIPTVAIAAILAGAAPSLAAEPRGESGSVERANWCRGRLIACVDEANKLCKEQFPNDAAKERQCGKDTWRQCGKIWGDSCETRERPDPGDLHAPGAPPEEQSTPSRPSAPKPSRQPGKSGSPGQAGGR
jgi:hypothetical protein